MSTAFDTKVASPVLSPSLNEYGEALLTDENAKVFEMFAAVQPDINAHTNLGSAVVSSAGHVSQVTGRQQSAVCTTPGGEKVRVATLVSLDSSGNPVPFQLKSKFQSTAQTGTGSAQSIAHGLGVVPSLVLASVQNSDGIDTWTIVEGTHTTTNLVLTVTSGVGYKVIAFA